MRITAEEAATEIRRAYQTCVTQKAGANPWMAIAQIAERVDLTKEEITAGVLHLNQTDDTFHAVPESNQKTLTSADREAALWIGNQWKHLISWG